MDYAVIITGIMIIAQFAKDAGLSKKFVPVLNLILGIAAGIIYVSPFDWKAGLLKGIAIGATASGFYSTGKNVYEGISAGGVKGGVENSE